MVDLMILLLNPLVLVLFRLLITTEIGRRSCGPRTLCTAHVLIVSICASTPAKTVLAHGMSAITSEAVNGSRSYNMISNGPKIARVTRMIAGFISVPMPTSITAFMCGVAATKRVVCEMRNHSHVNCILRRKAPTVNYCVSMAMSAAVSGVRKRHPYSVCVSCERRSGRYCVSISMRPIVDAIADTPATGLYLGYDCRIVLRSGCVPASFMLMFFFNAVGIDEYR